MAKKLEVNGKIAKFRMTIKGGTLPDEYTATIDVEMNFEGATNEQLFKCCASGQSARVALQAGLRKKTTRELNALAENGLKISFTDIMAGKSISLIDRIMALELEDLLKLMVEDFNMTTEQATKLYNKKHGIQTAE